jgi:hypothetical protein
MMKTAKDDLTCLILFSFATPAYTVNQRLAVFPSPARMSLLELSLAGNNVITIPGQGEFGQ